MKKILLLVSLFVVAVSYSQQTTVKTNGADKPVYYNSHPYKNSDVPLSSFESMVKTNRVDNPVFYDQKKTNSAVKHFSANEAATSASKYSEMKAPLSAGKPQPTSMAGTSTSSDVTVKPISAIGISSEINGIPPLEKSLFGTYGFISAYPEGQRSMDQTGNTTSLNGGGFCETPILEINQTQETTCMSNIASGRFSQSYIAETPYSAGAGFKFRVPPSIGLDFNFSLWDGIPYQGGTMIASGTGTTDGTYWADVFWDSVASVTIGNTYHIDVRGDISLPCFSGSSQNPYPGGSLFLGINEHPANDLNFRTFSCDDAGTGVLCRGTGSSNNFEGLINFSQKDNKIVAADITIGADVDMMLETFHFAALVLDDGSGNKVDNVNVFIYEDSGAGSPGALLTSQTAIIPVSQDVIGEAFGYKVRNVGLNLTGLNLLGTAGVPTTYWIGLSVKDEGNGNNFWETSSGIITGYGLAYQQGSGFVVNPAKEVVYKFTGSCSPLDPGGNTGATCNQKNPSNNFENSFSVAKNQGQQLATDFQVSDRTNFIMEKITVNIWMEPGETLTSADISFYNHDAVNLQPASFRNEQLAVVPVSQTVIGNKDGYDISEVVFEIAPELFSGVGGATTYWVSIYADVSNNRDGFMEANSSNIEEYTLAHSTDGGAYWNRLIGWDSVYVIEGRCETIDPNICIQNNPSNHYENGLSVSKNKEQMIATDFNVDAYTDFTMEKITVNIWVNTGDTLTSADISFYDHDAGSNFPGTLRNTHAAVVPVSQTMIGHKDGHDVFEVVFDITPELLPGVVGTSTKYWVSIFADISLDNNGLIEATSESIADNEVAYSYDDGATWKAMEGWDTVYLFEGICENLDGNICGEVNPANNFQEAFGTSKNLDQVIATDITVPVGKDFNLERITVLMWMAPYDYLTSADITFYDNDGDLPGAVRQTLPAVVPVSRTLIEDNIYEFYVWEIVFEIDPVLLPGIAGGKNTYWVSLYVDLEFDNAFIESTTASIKGAPQAYSSDRGVTWGVNEGWDTVYVFEGLCVDMGTGGSSDLCTAKGLSNDFEDMISVDQNRDNIVAADITIASDENMMLETINFTAFIWDDGSGTKVDNVNVFIYEDSGAGSPGALLTSQVGIIPVSQAVIGEAFGHNAWNVSLDITDVNLLGTAGAATTYWIGLSVRDELGNGNNFWETSSAGINGHGLAYDHGGAGFVMEPGLEVVYKFSGTCSPMEPSGDLCGGTGLSNNFEDMISFAQNGDNIVAADITIAADENMMLETINFTAFILDDGTAHKADNVNVYIYEDSGAGSPGALLTSQVGIIPVSQAVIGERSGYKAWDVGLDIADVNLPGTAGTATTYWIGLSVRDEGGNNNFWETSSAGVNGYGLAYDHGGAGFVMEPALEVVYKFSGTCSPMDPTPELCGGTGPSNNFEDMISFAQNGDNIVAADITIASDEDMMLETINFTAFIWDDGTAHKADNVNVYIYEDSGAGSPGALLTSQIGIIPVSQAVIGERSGYKAWDVSLDIADVNLPGTAGTATTYWIGLSVRDEGNGNNFWETSSAGVNGYGLAYDHGGAGFVMEPALEVVYKFSGTCSPMEPSGNLCGITGPSNNFQDGKNFTKTLGRIAANDITVADGEDMLLQTIKFSAFINGGSGVNASNVDVFIYSDSGMGSPGTLFASQTGTIPVSQTVVGSNYGYDIWSIELDITDIDLPGQVGANTTYWIGLSLETTDASETYWEYSSASVIGYGIAYNDGSGFVVATNQEGVYTFSGTCSATTSPSNDNCSGAIALECGDTVTGDTSIATDSGGKPSPDVFYKYTGSGTAELVTISLCGGGTDYDSLIHIFDDCDLSNEIAINDDFCGLQSELSFESDGTSTYYIMVEGSGLASGNFEVTITCETIVGPSNDNCSGAIALECGDTVTGDTSIATDSGGKPSPDVFYKYTGSGTAELVTISLCGGGTDYDSLIHIFDDCDLSNEIAINDDFCGLQSELSFQSDGTSTYYIMVEGSGLASGNFEVNITCEAIVGPSNDNCSGAIVLTCGSNVTGDTTLATDSGGNPASDLFYKFTGNGTVEMVTISLCGGGTDYDSVLRVFDNCDLSNEIAMNDDFCGLQSELSFESNGTSTYFIMVEGAAVAAGKFSLNVSCENLSIATNELEGFSYYPNPTYGVLNLNSKKDIEMVTIHNILGQKVLSQKVGTHNTTMDISRLSIGTYIMEVIVNGQVGVYKIIKK